ncbi:MAG TPA: hypothetical protein VGM21_11050 [Actinomycetota bacterium]
MPVTPPAGPVVRPEACPAAGLVARLYSTVTNALLAALGFVLLLTPTGCHRRPAGAGGRLARRPR